MNNIHVYFFLQLKHFKKLISGIKFKIENFLFFVRLHFGHIRCFIC